MRAYERLLKYVSVYTTSDPDSATVPSSMRQYDLANILVDELKALGLENVHVDENGVVYGWLSATAGCEQKPALGFIAHLDTSRSAGVPFSPLAPARRSRAPPCGRR